jgi:hypothetical protein
LKLRGRVHVSSTKVLRFCSTPLQNSDCVFCAGSDEKLPSCDSAATHLIPGSEDADDHGIRMINLSNIKLAFLPPNVTSHVQPLDQGIIGAFKAHCRRYVAQWIIAEAPKPTNAERSLSAMKPTFHQMMQWIHKAWTQDVTRKTIRNCWHHANIAPVAWFAEEGPDMDEDVAVVKLQDDLDDLARLQCAREMG